MDVLRSVAWFLGFLAIAAGAFLLYSRMGLHPGIAIVFLAAGIAIYAGLAVMAYAATARSDATPAAALDDSPFLDETQGNLGRR